MTEPSELVEAVRTATRDLEAARRKVHDLSVLRDRQIAELHDAHGWSYGRIAEATGLSRGRIQQIIERHRDR